jgi:hypothetical protein
MTKATATDFIVTCQACGWSLRPWIEETLVGMPSKCHTCGSLDLLTRTMKPATLIYRHYLSYPGSALVEISEGEVTAAYLVDAVGHATPIALEDQDLLAAEVEGLSRPIYRA